MNKVPKDLKIIKLEGEEIYVGTSRNGRLLVVSEPKISSYKELSAYVERANKRLMIALKKKTKSIIVITTKRPLPLDKIRSMERKYSLNILFIKIRSSDGGTVYSRWPPDFEWLSKLESYLSKELKRRNNIENFRLIKGVIALYVFGDVEKISKLNREEEIYLVDVGPIDIAEKYRGDKEAIIRLSDIFYYLEKLKIS